MTSVTTRPDASMPGDGHNVTDQSIKPAQQAAIDARDRMYAEVQDQTRPDARSAAQPGERPVQGHSQGGEPTHLTMTDAYSDTASTSTRTARSSAFDASPRAAGDRGAPATADHPKQTWTVAVDLSSSGKDRGVTEGGDRQLADLKRLAEQTKGTPVTFMVQDTHPTPGAQSGPDGKTAGNLDRYIIRDGKIQALPPVPSQGPAGDTESLLHWAGSEAPSDKLALISQGHGFGVDGLRGDTGMASLKDFDKAIKNGLAGTGHERLDVLDLDRCQMGAAGVESALHSAADHIISSEESEQNDGKAFDAQKLSAPLGDLLHAPTMSPSQFADTFVAEADKGANGKPTVTDGNGKFPHAGTDTLAHFDSSQYGQFAGRLGELGSVLSSASADPAARRAIEGIIADTPTFPDGQKSQADDERDIKSFAQKLITATADGSLADKDHSISQAAQKLLEGLQAMTLSYHGEHSTTGYDQMGGLSTFMPHGAAEDRTHDKGDKGSKGSVRDPQAEAAMVRQVRMLRQLNVESSTVEGADGWNKFVQHLAS